VNAAPAPLHNALRHGAIVAGFSAFIALALSIARGDWVLQLVYAEAIGLSIWACTELGRHGLGVDPQSGWRWAVLQVTAVVAGYAIGTGLGDPLLRLLELRVLPAFAAHAGELSRPLRRDHRRDFVLLHLARP
jgi:hypothetical protein